MKLTNFYSNGPNSRRSAWRWRAVFDPLRQRWRGCRNPSGVAATVNSLIAVQLLSGAEYLEVFEAGQLHALSRLARNAFGFEQDVGFIFVGLGSTVFAYLLLRSRYIPRILAGWGVFASLLFTTYNFSIIVFPGVEGTLMYVSFAPIGIYEIVLGFWLLLS